MAVAGVALVVSACSSPGEIASEQILENIEGVDDVDINTDTGEINFETEEGSFSFGGGEVPEELDIDVAPGGEVLADFVANDAVSVTLQYPVDSFDDVTGFYESWTASSGDEWSHSSQSFDSADGVTMRSESWVTDGYSVLVSNCQASTETSGETLATCVTLLQE